MSGSGGVRTERAGAVTTVIMNRPSARNAVNGAAARELCAAFEEFDRDDTASVAVLWGDNGTFCAGADLKAIGTGLSTPLTSSSTRSMSAMSPWTKSILSATGFNDARLPA